MMTIKQIEVTVGEITKDYVNNEEQGVRGYGGRLDIRPPYQREFIYNDKEQQAVITTVLNGYPLNVMYWVKRGEDAECPYEIMDGQQRTLSLCEYVAGKFSYEFRNFFNQPADIQKRILDYKLTIYVCEGKASEKLEWFKTINIAGKPLNEQEINNAVYAGPFVTDAKRHFSKSNCGAYRLGRNLVNGTPLRQDYLKKALEWIADHETRNGKRQSAVGYMAEHQHDPNANNLWTYFQNVLNWAITNFDMKKFKTIMKGLDWAKFYDENSRKTLDVEAMAKRIFKKFDKELLIDVKIEDGAQVKPGDVAMVVSGKIRSLLQTERLMLNVMQRMSGIATVTHKYQSLLKGTHTKVLDTRKTTPGMRVLEKMAVKIGGGENHRMGLYDMILLKDNHVDFAGGIKNAIERFHKYIEETGKKLKIEIEVRNFEELQEVLEHGGVNRIMLDNFTVPNTRKAVEMIGGKYETESSGGITIDTIKDYAECGVDFVSVGALTHSVKSLDISFKAF